MDECALLSKCPSYIRMKTKTDLQAMSKDFTKLDRFTSLNLRYCHYPLNLNHPNLNIGPYGKKSEKIAFRDDKT